MMRFVILTLQKWKIRCFWTLTQSLGSPVDLIIVSDLAVFPYFFSTGLGEAMDRIDQMEAEG